jgi:hypothetical protein
MAGIACRAVLAIPMLRPENTNWFMQPIKRSNALKLSAESSVSFCGHDFFVEDEWSEKRFDHQ